MDVQLTVWFDDEQTVKPGETSRIGTNNRRHTSHFAAAALAVSLFPLFPLEKFDTSVKGFTHARVCRWVSWAILGIRAAEQGTVRVGIDLPYLHLVQAELPGRPVHERLEHGHALHAARAALCATRRSVGGHRNTAKAQRRRLIEERCQHGRYLVIALPLVWTAVLDDEEVHGGDAAVLSEPNLHAGLVSRPHPADEGFLLA